MRYDELPDPGPGRDWIFIPETMDFDSGVESLSDVEFLAELMSFMVEARPDSPLAVGGPAIAFPDVVNGEI